MSEVLFTAGGQGRIPRYQPPPRRAASRALNLLAILLIAAGMGLAAFLPIYLLFNGGHLTSDALPFRRSGTYWFLALLASTAGFPTYCWLIRRRSSHDL